MAMLRRRGFTLIELLVVIAIIAILAAMLFPVFARARESARKIQCLSNVKNIAIAVQMYLADFDAMPPGMHDQAFQDAFDSWADDEGCSRATWVHPFMRWQVILDEYVRNRDVWRCPSQKLGIASVANIIPSYTSPWWNYLMDNIDALPDGPCYYAFPPGWGGSVTDSIAQQKLSGVGHSEAGDAVEIGIGTTEHEYPGVKTSQIGDPVLWLVCADVMPFPNIHGPETTLYEVCRANCGGDWANCPDVSVCSFPQTEYDKFMTDSNYREKYTRHLGGSNYGFADGHAAWYKADAFMAAAPHCTNINCDAETCTPNKGVITGICP